MQTQAQAHLLGELEDNIQRFDRESDKHKRLYRRCQNLVIGLTAVTSVVAGLGLLLPGGERYSQFAVLCLSAGVSAVTAWGEMRRLRELWQHEREVFYALVDLRRELEFARTYGELGVSDLQAYFARMNVLLGSSSQQWAQIHQQRADQGKP